MFSYQRLHDIYLGNYVKNNIKSYGEFKACLHKLDNHWHRGAIDVVIAHFFDEYSIKYFQERNNVNIKEDSFKDDIIEKGFINSLTLIDPIKITDEVKVILCYIYENFDGLRYEIINKILELSLKEECCLNALFAHKIIKSLNNISRDCSLHYHNNLEHY